MYCELCFFPCGYQLFLFLLNCFGIFVENHLAIVVCTCSYSSLMISFSSSQHHTILITVGLQCVLRTTLKALHLCYSFGCYTSIFFFFLHFHRNCGNQHVSCYEKKKKRPAGIVIWIVFVSTDDFGEERTFFFFLPC
jgi:hypothetical protein